MADGMSFDPKEHPRNPRTGEFENKNGATPPDAGTGTVTEKQPAPAPHVTDITLQCDYGAREEWFEDEDGRELDYCSDCGTFHYLDDVDEMSDGERAKHHLVLEKMKDMAPTPEREIEMAAARGTDMNREWAEAEAEEDWDQCEREVLEECGLETTPIGRGLVPVDYMYTSEGRDSGVKPTDEELKGTDWIRMPDGRIIRRQWAHDEVMRAYEQQDAIMQVGGDISDRLRKQGYGDVMSSALLDYDCSTGVTFHDNDGGAVTVRISDETDYRHRGKVVIFPGWGHPEDAKPGTVMEADVLPDKWRGWPTDEAGKRKLANRLTPYVRKAWADCRKDWTSPDKGVSRHPTEEDNGEEAAALFESVQSEYEARRYGR